MERGREKIEWAARHMPLLGELRREFAAEQPFHGRRIAMSIHLEAKTACLAILLRDGGARVAVTGSNPTLDARRRRPGSCEEDGISVYARRGVSAQEYTDHLRQALSTHPDLVLDDGGDLVEILHEDGAHGVLGGCEETTTGVARLRRRASRGELAFPMFAVNDARMKCLFDNRHGTGQSVWDAMLRSTNLLIAGGNVVVAGYGWCGRGIALRARGLGARVTVTEVDPVKAIEAAMDGFTVAPMRQAIESADFVVTATGCIDVVSGDDLAVAKDGVLLGECRALQRGDQPRRPAPADPRESNRPLRHRRAHARERAAGLSSRRRALGQSRARRWAPDRDHGHFVRASGAHAPTHRVPSRASPGRIRGAGRGGHGRGAPPPCRHIHRYRRMDRGSARLHEHGRRLTAATPPRPQGTSGAQAHAFRFVLQLPSASGWRTSSAA